MERLSLRKAGCRYLPYVYSTEYPGFVPACPGNLHWNHMRSDFKKIRPGKFYPSTKRRHHWDTHWDVCFLFYRLHASVIQGYCAFDFLQLPSINWIEEFCSCIESPWSSHKNFPFRKFWRSYLDLLMYLQVDQNLPRITNPVSDMTGDQ
jgi:hypothetical protein